MKRRAAQRVCALLAALALCAALGAGVFAEAAPGPAESPAASGVESAAQTQGQGQSGAESEETADSALSHQPETPADEPSLTEEGAQAGQAAGNAGGQAGAEQDAGAQAALQSAAAPAPQGTGLAETTGLTITADDGQPLVQGVDYELSSNATSTPSNMIILKTERAVTVTGSSKDNYGLQVAAGVHARITFNGVTIAAPIPFDIVTNINGTADGTLATRGYQIQVEKRTTVHLTLADKSKNELISQNAHRAALHCGEGSVLIIDDSVWNQTAAGEAITPEQGRVPYDCTLKNGTELKQGDPLWKMDSEAPGELKAVAVSSGSAAGIGGNRSEESGSITINGGNLDITGSFAGAGIGGGHAGGTGCTLEGGGVTINGGRIMSRGGYHSSGIGAGCVNGHGVTTPSAFSENINSRLGVCPQGHLDGPIPGDIIVNGGYTETHGAEHGNALGSACSNANNLGHGSENVPHEILITGGTLNPISERTSSSYDVGAFGGKVIVTGGSFPVGKQSGGVDGLSFQGTSVESASGEKLTMVEIDLSDYKELLGGKVISYEVSIGGVPLEPEYGLANIIDTDGKLYFWLPKSAVGQPVEISGLKVLNTSGEVQDGEYPFVVPEVGQNGNIAKRYVTFEVDESQFSADLKSQLNKRYDGNPFDWEKLTKEIVKQGIEVAKPDGKKLTDASAMDKPLTRRYLDKNGQPTGETDEATAGGNAGTYELTVISYEFAEDEDFAATFWGHRAKLNAKITPADSRVTDFTYSTTGEDKTETLTLTANVKPQTGEARTCEAPDGYVQFYINGVAVGAPVELAKLSAQTDTDGYYYRTASVTFDFTRGGYPAIPSREDGKFIIEAKHYGSTNYTDSEGAPIELEGADLPGGGLPTTDPPEAEIKPGQPGGGENGKPLEPDKVEPNPDGSGRLDSYVTDKVVRPAQPGAVLDKEGAEDFINDRYEFTDNQGKPLEPDEIIIYDKEGNDITDKGIDLSKPGDYVIHVKVEDENGNSTTVDLDYIVKDPPEVEIKPGQPGEPEKDEDGEDKPGTGTLQPEDEPHQGGDGLVHQSYKDVVYEKVENTVLSQQDVEKLVNGRYEIPAGSDVSVVIKDSTGKVVTGIDKSHVTHYTVEVVVKDGHGNSTTIHLRYQLYDDGSTPPSPGSSGDKGNPKTRA
ncbi:MAG: Ig-like domain-containing protein [Ruthenibacterium sp.]